MIQVTNVDFRYYTHYDYDTRYDCKSYGCDSICRCGRIYNEHITSVDIKAIVDFLIKEYYNDKDISAKRNSTIDSILGNIGREINYYTVDRILRLNKIYDPNKWSIKVVSGYYGQEIEEVKLFSDIAKKIDKQLEEAFDIVDLSKRVEYLLELEYGYILPELQGCKYQLIEVNKDDIIAGSSGQYKKVSKEDIEHYNKYNSIKGVVIQNGSKYRLIDGYHRFFANKSTILNVLNAVKCS